MQHLGVMMSVAAEDPEGQARLGAFAQELKELGWAASRNVRIDTRWRAGGPENHGRFAAELVALAPDVILAGTSLTVAALQQATRTAAIVIPPALLARADEVIE
jgi:putative tryptophan/tyrosine transport system substrate-binding protein